MLRGRRGEKWVRTFRTPNANGAQGPCVFVRVLCPRSSGGWRRKGELLCAQRRAEREAGERSGDCAFDSGVLLTRESG